MGISSPNLLGKFIIYQQYEDITKKSNTSNTQYLKKIRQEQLAHKSIHRYIICSEL